MRSPTVDHFAQILYAGHAQSIEVGVSDKGQACIALLSLAVLRSHLVVPASLSYRCCQHAMSELTILVSDSCMPCASLQVKLVLALIQNVTGIGLNAFFAPVSSNGDVAESPPHKGFMWQRADGFGHAVRRWIIRRVRALLGQGAWRILIKHWVGLRQQLGAQCVKSCAPIALPLRHRRDRTGAAPQPKWLLIRKTSGPRASQSCAGWFWFKHGMV